MRRALLIVALTACGGGTRSAPPPVVAAPPAAPVDPDVASLVELAKNGPGLKQYPEADAVVAVEDDAVTLAADGTVVERHRSVVRILDAQRGKEKFADVHIPYDTSRQTLSIERARTINGDGTVRVASPDEISEILPPQLEDATLYSGVRARVISFPAVDRGSVIELAYTRTTKPTADAPLGGELLLGRSNPILSRKVTVTAPRAIVPKLAVLGTTLAPTESSDAAAGTHSYSLVLTNLPDRQPELGAPSEEALLPRLVFSFAADWKQVAARVRATPAAAGDGKVKAKAAELVAGAKDDAERARALFRFVAHDVRSIDLPLGWAGYVSHAPEVVLANGYGDERDKVGLFVALCAAVNLGAQPVLVRTGKVPVVPSVPTVAQFDRMLARVRVGADEVWVDPADDDGQMGVAPAGQDGLVLVLGDGGEPVPRPALDPKSSVSRVVGTFTLSGKGDLEGRYEYSLSGWFASRASGTLRAVKGANLSTFFQQTAASFSASAVDVGHEVGDLMSVAGPIAISQKLRAPGYSPAQGRFRVLQLPEAPLGFAAAAPPSGLTSRKDPLWIGTPRTMIEELSLTVPAGWKVAYVPAALETTSQGMRYRSSCTSKGRTVSCRSELVFNALQIDPVDYPAFRDAMTRLAGYDQGVVLLTSVR